MSLYLNLNWIKLWICKINLLQNVAFKAETLNPDTCPNTNLFVYSVAASLMVTGLMNKLSATGTGGATYLSSLSSRSNKSSVSCGQRYTRVFWSQLGTCFCREFPQFFKKKIYIIKMRLIQRDKYGKCFLTWDAQRKRTGMNLKFKLPCWMNSFCIWQN